MKRNTFRTLKSSFLTLGLISALALSACSDSRVSADENAPVPESGDKSLVEQLAAVFEGPETVTVPAGTLVTVEVKQHLDSKSTSAGASFEATLARPIQVGDETIIEPGAEVKGIVQEVERSKRVKGRAQMVLALDSISVNEGQSVDVDTERLQIKASGEVKKDALTIGGSSAVGAVIGALTGGGDGAAKGAGIGAAAGAGYVLLTRGDEVEIPFGTQIVFVLASDVEVPVTT